MSDKRSLAKNTVYSAMSSASNIFLIILVIAAARVLGDKAFGYFSYALAVTAMFEMLTDLGLNTLSARNIPRDRTLAVEYLPNILAWKLLLSIVAVVLMVGTVRFMNQPAEARLAAYIMGIAMIIRSYKATSFGFFQSHERFDLILLTTYIERGSALIVGLIVLVLTRNLIAFALAFALIRVPDIIITYWLVHRYITPVRFRLEPGTVKSLQRDAAPFALSSIVLVAYINIGTVILSSLRPANEVGWYNAGLKIYEGLTMFPFLISTVLLPRLSKLFASERERYTDLCIRSLRYLVMASLPLIVLIGLHSRQIIDLVYGHQYGPGIPALRVLLVASALMFMNWVLNTMLISANLERMALRNWAVGLATLVSASFVLVRTAGMIGAAYAVLAAETCVCLLMMLSAHKRLLRIPSYVFAKPLLAGIPAYLAAAFMPVSVHTLSFAIFAVIYIGILLILRAFDPCEWSAARTLISRIGCARRAQPDGFDSQAHG